MSTHPFERCGLGMAPYSFVGIEEKTYQACPGAPVQPGSSCQYCGTGIRYVCNLLSADGKRFHVGCDCVMKVYRDYGVPDRMLTEIQVAEKKIMRKKNRERAAARDVRVSAEIEALLAANADRMAAMPTLSTYEGYASENLHQYFTRILGVCGAAGRARTLKTAKRILNDGVNE